MTIRKLHEVIRNYFVIGEFNITYSELPTTRKYVYLREWKAQGGIQIR